MKADRKMKILVSMSTMIAVLLLTLGLSACANSAKTKSLYAHGLDVVRLMSEMTQSEEYAGLHTGSSEIKSIIQNISAGDYTTPKAVYAISVTEENLAAMAELDNLGHASEGLKSFLMQRLLGALMTQINGRSGAENLAAAALCTGGKTFVNENVKESVIYLYTYDHAVPAAVTFTVGEDQAISASGVFILYDGFTCGSADEIKSFFSDVTVEVTEIPPEK